MKIARHPWTGKPVTISQYRAEFGPPFVGTVKANRPPATCPGCWQNLLIRGEIVAQDHSTFSHFPATPGQPKPFCPIKASASHKYTVLCPVDEDPARTKALRDSFFKNWRIHWLQFRNHLGFVDIKDFINALKVADKEHVWRYRALQEHEVIIVLMLISDFKPVAGKGKKPLRANWVRFWFESRAQTFSEFWNLSNDQKVIIRVEYEVPEGRRALKPDYACAFEEIDVSTNYLLDRQEGDDAVHAFVESMVLKAFRW